MDDPLWTFSLSFYARSGVQDACLELQDEAGADVNFLLFLLWCAQTGRPLDASAIAAADASITPWRRAVIEPLRGARRALRAHLLAGADTADFRTRLKAVELEAERLAQVALVRLAPGASEVASAEAARYLELYASHLGRVLPQQATAFLLKALVAFQASPPVS